MPLLQALRLAHTLSSFPRLSLPRGQPKCYDSLKLSLFYFWVLTLHCYNLSGLTFIKFHIVISIWTCHLFLSTSYKLMEDRADICFLSVWLLLMLISGPQLHFMNNHKKKWLTKPWLYTRISLSKIHLAIRLTLQNSSLTDKWTVYHYKLIKVNNKGNTKCKWKYSKIHLHALLESGVSCYIFWRAVWLFSWNWGWG